MPVMHLRLPLFVVVALGVGWLGACSPGPSQTEGLHDSRDSSGGESDTVSVEQAPQVDRGECWGCRSQAVQNREQPGHRRAVEPGLKV